MMLVNDSFCLISQLRSISYFPIKKYFEVFNFQKKRKQLLMISICRHRTDYNTSKFKIGSLRIEDLYRLFSLI